ncbi:MAG: fasciclin domain-containing protein, partial [Pseudomonadota bacterium]
MLATASVSPAVAGGNPETALGTIVETAVAADDFNTLVAAVQAAGLVDTLSGDGPFTVFAPTDAA